MKFLLIFPSLIGRLNNDAGLKRSWEGPLWRNTLLGLLIFNLSTAFAFPGAAQNPTPGFGSGNISANTTILDPTWKVGSWIWTTTTYDQQLCRFWRTFEIPPSAIVVKARLRIAVDNSYQLFLDGHELGRGSFWRDLMEYDLTALSLKPGSHVLAVEAFNDFGAAGLLAGVQLELADGKMIEVASDASWKIAPANKNGWEKMTQASKDWPAAKIIHPFGAAPWDKLQYLFKATQLQPPVIRFWQTGWFSVALVSFCVVVLIVCIQLLGKLTLQAQSNQVIRRERARIARDLHDDLTSGLTQLVLLGEIARSELPTDSQSSQQVNRVCEKARSLSRSLNEIIWVVNSQRDTLQDFASYICKYAETFMQPTAIRCRFDLGGELSDLSCDLGMRRNLFLAVKEALNNVVRHSEAGEVRLRIHRQGAAILVAIEDDGKGFLPAEADRARNGLSNLMKRAADAGGICRINSQPGSGCRIEFIVPLARPVRGRFQQGFRIMRGRQPFENKIQPATTPAAALKSHDSHSIL